MPSHLTMPILPLVLCLLSTLSLAHPSAMRHGLAGRQTTAAMPRLVVYYQTTHDKAGMPISMLPLITQKNISLTHLIVAAFHVNANRGIHFNDYPPSHQRFSHVWQETRILQDAGVVVTAMVGGAAAGSFSSNSLDSSDSTVFERCYSQLHGLVTTYGLQGLDLDVEQPMSQAGISRLIKRLHADFGSDFLITLAPVASALSGGSNLSGFSYRTLAAAPEGDYIGFYNTQFYDGFGSMATPDSYQRAVELGGFSPDKVVAGQLIATNTDFNSLRKTVQALVGRYGSYGGFMAWEAGAPSGTSATSGTSWAWAQLMSRVLRPNFPVKLSVTRENATSLALAWQKSVVRADDDDDDVDDALKAASRIIPNVDYMAMVNA